MNLYISFKANDFNRYMSALTRLDSYVPKIADNMCRYGAIEYKTELLQAFSTQNFATRIPKLRKKYLQWKIEHGFPRDIGRLRGDLFNSIGVFRWWDSAGGTGTTMMGWLGGVDPTKFDGGGKNWALKGPSKMVVKYGMWFEEGNRFGQPDYQAPRPVFTSTGRRYIRLGYPKQVDKAARRIEQSWH